MSQLLESMSHSSTTAESLFADIIAMSRTDAPFVLQVAVFASHSTSWEELHRHLSTMYRIALDAGHPFLPDLIDSLMRLVEREITQPAPLFASRSVR